MCRTAVLAAILTSLLICGCSSGDGPTADNGQGAASPTEAGPEPSHSPEDPASDNSEDAAVGTSLIETAITEVAGYTQNDVAAAVNAARFDSIVACMAKKGWDFSHSDLPDPGLDPNESIGPFGTQLEYFLDELAAPEDPPETVEAEDDADHPLERNEDEFECWVEADEKYPDPLQTMWAWLDRKTEDLDKRVRNDPRLAAAKEVSARCIAATGYDFTSMDDATGFILDAAFNVWNRYRSGGITRDDARSELLDLSTQAADLEEEFQLCDRELFAVIADVRAEAEAEFLNEHGDRIALIAADYSDRLDLYRDYLPDD